MTMKWVKKHYTASYDIPAMTTWYLKVDSVVIAQVTKRAGEKYYMAHLVENGRYLHLVAKHYRSLRSAKKEIGEAIVMAMRDYIKKYGG